MPGISTVLGGSINNNDDKEDDGNNEYTNDIHYEYNPTVDGPKSFVINREAALHQEGKKKKNWKQLTSAIKAMKQCGRATVDNGVGIGALMSLKVDYCTHCHTQGLLANVYKFNADTSGILVCCVHGIATHDGTSNSYWVPYDKYTVIAANVSTFPMFNKLQGVQGKVLAGNIVNDAGMPRISFLKYVDIDLVSASPVKKARGCSCKRGCNKGCGF